LRQQMKEIDHDIAKCHKAIKLALDNNDWVRTDEAHFGKVGSSYDFAKFGGDGDRMVEMLNTLPTTIAQSKTEKAELERKVNFKAMNLLADAETRCEDLEQRKAALLNDRQRLFDTISSLETKKEAQIMEAHKKVNKDFGNIFTTLLPGTMAELRSLPGKRVLDGLEICVAFGKVWKESLNELSGGQRSLVALSLVLAMLKFKPAPIYILDEVDAALDMSHTQNIGSMIKQHFKDSQFIIVSLKDGMFNNANVLFKTKFVDGCSTVARIVSSTAVTRDDKENQRK